MRHLLDRWYRVLRGRRHHPIEPAAGPVFEPLESRTLLSIVPLGPELLLDAQGTVSVRASIVVAADDGQFLAAWSQHPPSFSAPGTLILQRFDSSGLVNRGRTVLEDKRTSDIMIDVNSRGDIVFVTDGDDLYVLKRNGGQPKIVAEHYGGGSWRSALAVDHRGIITTAWPTLHVGGDVGEVWVRRMKLNGKPREDIRYIVRTDAPSQIAVVDREDGSVVVAWVSKAMVGLAPVIDGPFSVLVQRFSPEGKKVGRPRKVWTTTAPNEAPREVSISADAKGNLVVGWIAYHIDSGEERLMVQRLNEIGKRQGKPIIAASASRPSWDDGGLQNGMVSMGREGNFVAVAHFAHGGGLIKAYSANGRLSGSVAVPGVEGVASDFSITAGHGGEFAATWIDQVLVARVYRDTSVMEAKSRIGPPIAKPLPSLRGGVNR
jgi:hypothetical protein